MSCLKGFNVVYDCTRISLGVARPSNWISYRVLGGFLLRIGEVGSCPGGARRLPAWVNAYSVVQSMNVKPDSFEFLIKMCIIGRTRS